MNGLHIPAIQWFTSYLMIGEEEEEEESLYSVSEENEEFLLTRSKENGGEDDSFAYRTSMVVILFILYSMRLILMHPIEDSQITTEISNQIATRYYLSMCTAKELEYLPEFIDYHIKLGFDHLFIFDNNKGDYQRAEMEELGRHPQVTVIDVRDQPHLQDQWDLSIYNRITKYDWCFFCNTDEFLTFAPGITMKSYLESAEAAGCQQIRVNWMTYGNNGQITKTNGTQIERFPNPTMPLDFKKKYRVENSHTKVILKGGIPGIWWPTLHHVEGPADLRTCNGALTILSFWATTRGRNGRPKKVIKINQYIQPNFEKAWVRHYFTRSEQEWCFKQLKWSTNNHYAPLYNWDNYDSVNRYSPNVPRSGKINETNCELIV